MTHVLEHAAIDVCLREHCENRNAIDTLSNKGINCIIGEPDAGISCCVKIDKISHGSEARINLRHSELATKVQEVVRATVCKHRET
jgi:hypothetical protein